MAALIEGRTGRKLSYKHDNQPQHLSIFVLVHVYVTFTIDAPYWLGDILNFLYGSILRIGMLWNLSLFSCKLLPASPGGRVLKKLANKIIAAWGADQDVEFALMLPIVDIQLHHLTPLALSQLPMSCPMWSSDRNESFLILNQSCWDNGNEPQSLIARSGQIKASLPSNTSRQKEECTVYVGAKCSTTNHVTYYSKYFP